MNDGPLARIITLSLIAVVVVATGRQLRFVHRRLDAQARALRIAAALAPEPPQPDPPDVPLHLV